MKNKCIDYIKKKINLSEISDLTIERIMLATFSFLSNKSENCFYCQNFNKWGLFSLCKIHPHIQPNCLNHTINVDKMVKNSYGDIIHGCDALSPEINKHIIAESIKLYEFIKNDEEVEML